MPVERIAFWVWQAGGVAHTKFFRFLKFLVFWDLGGYL
jgi:hypothetical protein